ncbi:MAG: hypothetical protein Q9165_007206 [Trypethelium subeluteriae]
MVTFNENLVERFRGRNRDAYSRDDQSSRQARRPPAHVGPDIRNYMSLSYELSLRPQNDWTSLPELPAASEILPDDATFHQQSVDRWQRKPATGLNPNKPTGAWESENDYLRDQYLLLREDAVRPLRDAVALVRENPTKKEADFKNSVGIYDKVYVKGFTFSSRGVAVRITFVTYKAEKAIRWDMSKRLMTGSIVALSPSNDMFRRRCIVATVAARPPKGLELNPPELDLYLSNCSDLNVEAHQDYVMVEGRSGFYEAHRHTMTALQHMSKESFPLSEHVVYAEPVVGAPDYLQGDERQTDLSGTCSSLSERPQQSSEIGSFDPSQLAALTRMRTKKLPIVQGPPGTGKTHISVAAVKSLLRELPRDDPPILVSCQTNHALDQILRQIAAFEPQYARLGAFSKDPDIAQRSIGVLREEVRKVTMAEDLRFKSAKKMDAIANEIIDDLDALDPRHKILDPNHLLSKGIISQGQFDSLAKGAAGWLQHAEDAQAPLELWLGNARVPTDSAKAVQLDFHTVEDPETEIEAFRGTEAENVATGAEAIEDLNGRYVCVSHSYTGKKNALSAAIAQNLGKLLKAKDLWKIPQACRGHIYCIWLNKYKEQISEVLRSKATALLVPAEARRIGRWERDLLVLGDQRIIGMTTTGLSKYRALICALKPKICLIEEAGESLEGSVTSACLPSLQQLTLVGDHQQLRPSCHHQLHGEALHMNLSLFERLINNSVEYSVLSEQRRMTPEIRHLLYPIYGDILTDHELVTRKSDRPPIKGMGNINTFFLDHTWSESKDSDFSFVNTQEAKMVAGLYAYLVRSGEGTDKITVLTFYNGQRKEIERLIRDSQSYREQENPSLEVRTVDSYQGEEKDIVILALARYGSDNIGFLGNVNRICVAMSRARRGLYLFGNSDLLRSKSETWAQILDIMAGRAGKAKERPAEMPCRVGNYFPVVCEEHRRRTYINGELSAFAILDKDVLD